MRHAADSVLDSIGATVADASRPKVLASKLISNIDHEHAFLINRNKLGSMALPGESMFVLEMQPASYAILAVNEAEKAADIKVVDYRMIGATGRVYGVVYAGLDIGQAASPLVFGLLLDQRRWQAVLLGLAAMQGVLIASAFNVRRVRRTPAASMPAKATPG